MAIVFQSYYSLISNHRHITSDVSDYNNFNPIIVLFLTRYTVINKEEPRFQSYYSLISNHFRMDEFIHK